MKEYRTKPASQHRITLSVAIALLLGVMLPLSAAVVYAYRFTDSKPATLSVWDISSYEGDALDERIRVFRRAVQSGQTVEPLELAGRDLNALVRSYASMGRFPAKVTFAITGRGLEAHVTTTLGDLGVPVFQRRYLNAVALLNVSARRCSLGRSSGDLGRRPACSGLDRA
jgi:hypothetical protein